MRRAILVAVILAICLGAGFYVAPRKDFMTPLRSDVIKETHEFYTTDVWQPSGAVYTGPIYVERTTYVLPASDQSKILTVLRQETKKRAWRTAWDHPNDVPKHAVFGSTPTKSGYLIYMSDPYLLAVNMGSDQICIADVHEVTNTQYWLVRTAHPFSNPFPRQ